MISERIALDQIKVASPCPASWDEMSGDAQVRFCGRCAQFVYNLSEMTRDEAQELIAETEGKACIRFYQRADGTMMTKDCVVGAAAPSQAGSLTPTLLWAVGGGAVLTMLALAWLSLPPATMGKPCQGKPAPRAAEVQNANNP